MSGRDGEAAVAAGAGRIITAMRPPFPHPIIMGDGNDSFHEFTHQPFEAGLPITGMCKESSMDGSVKR